MVEVGGVEDGLIFRISRGTKVLLADRVPFCVHSVSSRSRKNADNVWRLEGADDAFDVGMQADGQFDGFEAAFAGGFALSVGVEIGGFEDLLGYVELDPACCFEVMGIV